MIACTIFEAIVTRSIWNTIRIGGTNEAIVARRSGWDTFRFGFRLQISMVASAIFEVIVAQSIWNTIRIGGTYIVIVAFGKRMSILKIIVDS